MDCKRSFVLLVLAGAWAMSAQAESRPSTARLKISVNREPAKYFLGERIPLKLAFGLDAAAADEEYKINLGQQSRRDGNPFESYFVTPSADTEDPLTNLDELGYVDSQSGVLGLDTPLINPVSLPEDLNEYIRFTKPGRYLILVQSRRISSADRSKRSRKNVEVSSNTLTIEIAAQPPEWARAQIARLNRDLPNLSRDGDRFTAARELSYLENAESVSTMIKWFTLGKGYAFHSILYEGLLDSATSELVIKGLTELLEDPSSSVPIDAVGLLATKILATEYRGKPLSELPPGTETMYEAREEREARLEELVSRNVKMLQESISKRTGSSRVQASNALDFVTQSTQ